MKKQVRKLMVAVLFTLLSAALFTGCGVRYIMNGNTNYLRKDDGIDFTIDKSIVEPLTLIEIHTGMAEVELIPSDDFYVEIDYMYWEEEPEYTLENGKLYFNDSNSFPNSYSINFNLDNKIKIYLPEVAALTGLQIENSSGDVTLAGFVAEDLEITVSYGDLTIKEAAASTADLTLSSGTSKITDFQVGELDFTNSYGNARFTNINTGEALLPATVTFDQFNLSMSSGDVDIKGLVCNSIEITDSYGNVSFEEVTATEADINLSSGNFEVSQSELQQIDTENSYGNVTLDLKGSASDYSFDLNTSYGNIKLEEKSYEEHLIIENDGTKKITADLSSGDVKVDFED